MSVFNLHPSHALATRVAQPLRAQEVPHKLEQMRAALTESGAAGLRLWGTDWFSWATAGLDHTVLLAAEIGVAEVLVTRDRAWLLTSEIEAARFRDEELPGISACYELSSHPWANGTLEDLTVDPNWPSVEIEGRFRPSPLER